MRPTKLERIFYDFSVRGKLRPQDSPQVHMAFLFEKPIKLTSGQLQLATVLIENRLRKDAMLLRDKLGRSGSRIRAPAYQPHNPKDLMQSLWRPPRQGWN